jgi:hypothetical protein
MRRSGGRRGGPDRRRRATVRRAWRAYCNSPRRGGAAKSQPADAQSLPASLTLKVAFDNRSALS